MFPAYSGDLLALFSNCFCWITSLRFLAFDTLAFRHSPPPHQVHSQSQFYEFSVLLLLCMKMLLGLHKLHTHSYLPLEICALNVIYTSRVISIKYLFTGDWPQITPCKGPTYFFHPLSTVPPSWTCIIKMWLIFSWQNFCLKKNIHSRLIYIYVIVSLQLLSGMKI